MNVRRGSLNSVKTTEGAEFRALQKRANVESESGGKVGQASEASLDGAEERCDEMSRVVE